MTLTFTNKSVNIRRFVRPNFYQKFSTFSCNIRCIFETEKYLKNLDFERS